ncbi:MAG: DUF535 family protein [Aquabacterium sp.]|nr:DUF535 family protein [Aquabacterium sp.]
MPTVLPARPLIAAAPSVASKPSAWAHLRAKWAEQGWDGLFSTLLRMGKVVLTWQQHQSLLSVIDQPGTRAVRAAFPRMPYRYTLPYLSTSLDWQARWSAMRTHYTVVNQAFQSDFSRRVLDDTLDVWRSEHNGHIMTVSVQGLCPVTRHREGELTLCFKMGGAALYKLSFSIVGLADLNLSLERGQTRSAHALYVGRVQGVCGAMEAIRQATTLLGDVAPQDVLMAVLSGLAAALHIDTVLGVSDGTCVSRDTIAQSGSSFCYGQFWARYGGQVLEGGHHLISLPVAEKPLSEIAAKHRKRTQRKREFKREVAAACEQAFRSVLA